MSNTLPSVAIIKEYDMGFRLIDICKKHNVANHDVIRIIYEHKVKSKRKS